MTTTIKAKSKEAARVRFISVLVSVSASLVVTAGAAANNNSKKPTPIVRQQKNTTATEKEKLEQERISKKRLAEAADKKKELKKTDVKSNNEPTAHKIECDWLDNTDTASKDEINGRRFSVFPIFRTPAPPDPDHLSSNREILSSYPDTNEEYNAAAFESHFDLTKYTNDVILHNVTYHCNKLRSIPATERRTRKIGLETAVKYILSVVKDPDWKKVYLDMIDEADTTDDPDHI